MLRRSLRFSVALVGLIAGLSVFPNIKASSMPLGSTKNLKIQGVASLSLRVDRGKLWINSVIKDTLDPTPGRYTIPTMPSSHLEISTDRENRELWIRAEIDVRDWKLAKPSTLEVQVPGVSEPLLRLSEKQLDLFIPTETGLARSIGSAHLFDDDNRIVGKLTPTGSQDSASGVLLTIESAKL